jgi:putative ABC transport system ATP-binding protein
MQALKATGVCRRYGNQEVLKDFSLELEAGGFEAMMGPSGSGKSTFIHLAAGLLSADAGEIMVGDRDVVKMRDAEATIFRRRHVGVVFQSFNLLNEKTVRENVMLPLVLESSAAAHDPKAKARFAELMPKLGLEGKENRKPEELSGGEQQRVAIARALIAEPEVVLADEPTGNLDAKSSRAICKLVAELDKTEKSAILVVTHDPQVAASARKVHFLKDGRIAASYDTNGDPGRVSNLYLETYR